MYFFSDDHKEIKKQIIDFEKIIEDIPFEKEFYTEEGYKIQIIKTTSYSIYPYSYKIINLNNDTYIQGSGISNHFENKEEAYQKAIFKIWNNYFLNNNFQTKNKYILNKIKQFELFVNKYIR